MGINSDFQPQESDPNLEAFFHAAPATRSASSDSLPRPGLKERVLRSRSALVLSIVLTCVVAWLWADMVDEVEYYFQDQEVPIQIDLQNIEGTLGDAEKLAVETALGSGRITPEGVYVRVQVTTGNKSRVVSGRRPGSLRWGSTHFRQVLGQALVIEFDPEEHDLGSSFVRATLNGRLRKVATVDEVDPVYRSFEKDFKWERSDFRWLLTVGEKPGEGHRYLVLLFLSLCLILFSWVRLAKRIL